MDETALFDSNNPYIGMFKDGQKLRIRPDMNDLREDISINMRDFIRGVMNWAKSDGRVLDIYQIPIIIKILSGENDAVFFIYELFAEENGEMYRLWGGKRFKNHTNRPGGLTALMCLSLDLQDPISGDPCSRNQKTNRRW